jgi:hypothetical protein
MPLRHAALAAALALAALPLRAEDTIVFVSARNHLVAYDLATGAECARFDTPGLSSDMVVTRDGVLLLNHRDGDTILVVDARRLRELARIPSSSMGGRRPVHGYLTPVIGGQQFFVALNDGVSTPGQPNTDNTALFIDVTPGSPTYLKPAGEVRLGQGHHKAAFHPTLPRMAVSNINDCEEIIGVYDFANPAAIRRVASSDARRLGLDGSSEAKTCTPTASRPGVRPAPHGAATEPVSGLAVHNLNGTGQFVLVDMGAEPSSFTALATRGWGGAAIGVHPFGRWLYGPQYAPREGDRTAPGLPCQVGQIAVIDGAKASVVPKSRFSRTDRTAPGASPERLRQARALATLPSRPAGTSSSCRSVRSGRRRRGRVRLPCSISASRSVLFSAPRSLSDCTTGIATWR